MLTDAAIRRIKSRDKPFKASDMHGLYLLVRPDGARYWRMDYRHAGKRGTLALGGERPVGDITAPEILTVLRTAEVRGRYETARDVCTRSRSLAM